MRVNKRAKKYVLHESVDSSMYFAIVGTAEKFSCGKHVRKCWEFCRAHQIKACLVLLDSAENGQEDKKGRRKGKEKNKLPTRVYGGLGAVPEQIDVVVPCLMPRHIPHIVEESADVGAHTLWFQENNWTAVFQEQAEEKGLAVVRGCMLKHRYYKGMSKFLHPCYWHGRQSVKVIPKYR